MSDYSQRTKDELIRRLRELESRESTLEQQARLLDLAYDAILAWEFDGTLIYWNQGAEALYGFLKSEAIGKVVHDLLSTQHPSPFSEFKDELARHRHWTGELHHIGRTGTGIFVESRQQVIEAPEGLLVLETNRDITARKAEEARATRAAQEVTELQKKILEISETEQRRIGADLHDGLGQRLTALEMLSQALVGKLKVAAPDLVKSAQLITAQIRETVTQTRLLSHNLSPVPLEADGLMAGLSELATGTETMAGIRCHFHCAEPVLLPSIEAGHLYRIAQEAVNNALKHSEATQISITLARREGSWAMIVEDNGHGLPPQVGSNTGLGFRMMKYRAQILGASLEIASSPHDGVRITCAQLRSP